MDRRTWQRRLWTIAKWLVVLAIFAVVGHIIWTALHDLEKHEISWRPSWLAPTGALYLFGLGFSALYWWTALRSLGQRPAVLTTIRAFYIGHLGKYIPGKALVIIMRTAMIRGANIRTSTAAVSVVYETLTCMAAGALIAAVLILCKIQNEETRLWQALLLVGFAGLPTLPWVFNPVMGRIVRPFLQPGDPPLVGFRLMTFLNGLLLGGMSWFVLGLSLLAVTSAVVEVDWTVHAWLRSTAALCIATVAAFLTPVPGGLGVREGILTKLLEPDFGLGPAGLIAILLRVTWIASELGATAVLYPIPMMITRTRTDP